MLDIDQRIIDGLHELVDRAPSDANVWAATEHYVAKRRRRRHTIRGSVVAVLLIAGVIATVGIVRGADSKSEISSAGPTTAGPHASLVPLAATGPTQGTLSITVGPDGALTFSPAALTATTGVYEIRLVNGSNARGDLQFVEPSVRFAGLTVNEKGQTVSTRAFFGAPGVYEFYDAVPGHSQAGQTGNVTVTGPALPSSAAGS